MAIRALILAGGASPHRPGLDAAWPGWDRDLDVVIAADAGALLAAPLGLSLDLIVGDGDSLGEEALAAFIEQGVAVERAPIDKDSSDTELALVAAAVRGATDLVVVGAFGGRLDHALANIWILAHPRLAGRTVALLDDRTRVRLLTASTTGSPTRTAVDLAGRAELRRGASLYATITGLAKIAGPGVAGIIIAATGETAVFFADAASFLGVIVVMTLLSGDTRHTPVPDHAVVAARRFRWVLDLPRGVQAAAAMALLLGGFGLQFAVTNPLMATRVFHLGAVGFGLLGTFAAVGGIAGNYHSSRRGDPGRSEFVVWALVFGIAECVAAVMPAAWAYDLTMVVIGGATQLFAVSATVYLQQATPAAQRGHALSAYNAGFMGFVPAGAFVVAGLAAVAGIRWALIGPGLLIAACAAGILAVRLFSERSAAGPPGRSRHASTIS